MTDTIDAIEQLSGLLKKTREQKGLSLAKMAEILKIPKKKLEDIEQGYFHAFHEAFLKGIIRSYAKHLNITHQVDELFIQVWAQPKARSYESLTTETSIPPLEHHWLKYGLIAALLAGLSLIGVWLFLQSDKKMPASMPSLNISSQTLDSPSQIPSQIVLASQNNDTNNAAIQNIQMQTEEKALTAQAGPQASAVLVSSMPSMSLQPSQNLQNTSMASESTQTVSAEQTAHTNLIQHNFVLELRDPTWVEVRRMNQKIIHAAMTKGSLELKIDEPIRVKIGNHTSIQKFTFDQQNVNIEPYVKGSVVRMTLAQNSNNPNIANLPQTTN